MTAFMTTGSVTAELAAQRQADLRSAAATRRLVRSLRQPRRVAPERTLRVRLGLSGIAPAR